MIKTQNEVLLIGTINEEPIFDHSIFEEGIYKIILKVNRTSDNFDLIPVLISERLIDLSELKLDTKIKIIGRFNSFNKREEGKSSLVLYVFTKEIEFIDPDTSDLNLILLKGFLCKSPTYRRTPLGREITDLLIAVNREYSKSDYIPCIAWGRNAKFANNFIIGDYVWLEGRIQSRDYVKRYDEVEINKTAYEVSIMKLSFGEV